MSVLILFLVANNVANIFGHEIPAIPRETRWIDMSLNYEESLLYHPDMSPFIMNVSTGYLNGFRYQIEEITVSTHAGTHIDAPNHFVPGQLSVDEIPIERLMNIPAIVIDISEKSLNNPDSLLEIEDIHQWEEEHGQMPNGSVLIMNTGYSAFFNDTIRYLGITPDSCEMHYPGLDPHAAQWIVNNRDIYGIGTDAYSIESPLSKQNNAHVIVERQNIYSLELLDNINELPPKGARLFIMPMKIAGASGAPCRVFASVPTRYSSQQ